MDGWVRLKGISCPEFSKHQRLILAAYLTPGCDAENESSMILT